MKKIAVFLLTAVLCAGLLTGCGTSGGRSSDEVIGEESGLDPSGMVHLEGADAVPAFMEEVYGGVAQDLLPDSIQTTELDVYDADLLEYHTGLINLTGVEAVWLSESFTGSDAYSAVYIVTNDEADVPALQEQLMENINPAKWVYMSAQKQISAVFGKDIFFVMGAEDTADEVFDSARDAAAARDMSVSGAETKNTG